MLFYSFPLFNTNLHLSFVSPFHFVRTYFALQGQKNTKKQKTQSTLQTRKTQKLYKYQTISNYIYLYIKSVSIFLVFCAALANYEWKKKLFMQQHKINTKKKKNQSISNKIKMNFPENDNENKKCVRFINMKNHSDILSYA